MLCNLCSETIGKKGKMNVIYISRKSHCCQSKWRTISFRYVVRFSMFFGFFSGLLYYVAIKLKGASLEKDLFRALSWDSFWFDDFCCLLDKSLVDRA